MESVPSFAESLAKATGRGVTIGILDTGVCDLPQFQGRIGGHFRVTDSDRKIDVIELPEGEDRLNHGTACADIILRNAPDVTVFDVQVINRQRENSRYQLAAAIRFATSQGWDILNISVGTQLEFERLREVTDEALAAGTILLSAIDNHAEKIGFPAAYPGVISVEHDYFDDPLGFRPGPPSDLLAHGIYVDALNAKGELQSFTGSSFACPHVAALAARAKEIFPGMNSETFLRELVSQDSQHEAIAG